MLYDNPKVRYALATGLFLLAGIFGSELYALAGDLGHDFGHWYYGNEHDCRG